MHRTIPAILAVAVLHVAAAALGPVDPPVSVSFRLLDGVRITGQLAGFDNEGFDGSFGRRRWLDLNTDDLWRTYRRVMDRQSSAQMIALGRLMLLAPGGEKRGEQALAEALRADPNAKPAVDDARRQVEEARRERQRREEAAQRKRLNTVSPEAAPFPPSPGKGWPGEPWEPVLPHERTQAVESLNAKAAEIMSASGGAVEPYETDHFTIFADGPRAAIVECGWQLEQAYKNAAELVGAPPMVDAFRGKAGVLIATERQRFELIEVQSFRQLVAQGIAGIVHYRDQEVWLSFHRDPQNVEFADLLAQQCTLAFLHRHQSALRLPAWANEGLAMRVGALTLPKSDAERARRRAAIQFIRAGGSVPAVLAAGYGDEDWVSRQPVVGAVGCLFVELMLRERPRAFAAWVAAVKSGKEWRQALVEDFGTPAAKLADAVVTYFKAND